MIKIFEFDYNWNGEARFNVDTEKFTPEMAKETLEFFSWDYEELNDPIEEVLKKYAMRAIQLATFYSFNIIGVKNAFESEEGFYKVDGSMGIELLHIAGYEFLEDDLTMTIK